jgi:prepilin-type N-terminal cleavage/methylation domain-containing protein
MRRCAFTLVEILVVVAIIALLVSLVVPLSAASRRKARVVKACAELRNIGLALECYARSCRERVPPGRTYCDSDKAQEWSDLPTELVDQHYLPSGSPDGRLSSAVEDEFNPGHTYKYTAPGWGYHNGAPVPKSLWIPDAFPRDEPSADPQTLPGRVYDNVSRPMAPGGRRPIPSPVVWVVWSLGPLYDPKAGMPPRAPIARSSWYRGGDTGGVIPRIRPLEGEQFGWQ